MDFYLPHDCFHCRRKSCKSHDFVIWSFCCRRRNTDGGQVKVLGKDISFPESVGVLIENPAFINAYTGFKNLRFLADIQKKITDEEIREAITEVGLNPDDKRSYRKYSLGMKERLVIAAAIMGTPELIILDEPLNGIDESGVEMIKKLIADLKNKSKLVIMSCHDAEDLYSLCNVVVNVSAGKIVSTEGEAK